MSGKSPTQRTRDVLKKQGIQNQIVEHWNAYAHRRVDLFGVIDLVAVKGKKKDGTGVILGIQTTAASGHSARKKKALHDPKVRPLLQGWLRAGGKFEIWSWGKKGPRGKMKRWTIRVEELTLRDFKRRK